MAEGGMIGDSAEEILTGEGAVAGILIGRSMKRFAMNAVGIAKCHLSRAVISLSIAMIVFEIINRIRGETAVLEEEKDRRAVQWATMIRFWRKSRL